MILSHWDAEAQTDRHAAINACLRPVASLNGLVVTTIEGTGSVRRPNPSFLRHTAVGGRAAAPLDVTLPVFVKAEAAAIEKRDAVLASALAAQAHDARPPRSACATPWPTLRRNSRTKA